MNGDGGLSKTGPGGYGGGSKNDPLTAKWQSWGRGADNTWLGTN